MSRHSKSFSTRVRTRPLCNIALDKVDGSVTEIEHHPNPLVLGLDRYRN